MPKDLESLSVQDVCFPMIMEENRLKSFSKDWPFDDKCVCTAEKMASAGFYHCPTPQAPDNVRCYSCLIELDSWDSNDDPWKEHYNHSIGKNRECEFMRFGKPQMELTVGEFLETVKGRHMKLIKNITDQNLEEFDKMTEQVREELLKIKDMFGK